MTKRNCSVAGCERPYADSGYCGMHRERVRKHGSPGSVEPSRIYVVQKVAICVVEGCTNPTMTRNFCNKHYLRVRRHGDPLGGGRYRQYGLTGEERLAAGLAMHESGCSLWTGLSTESGYGWVRVDGESIGTHRWAWELEHGPIPNGLHLDHQCHNRDMSCPPGRFCFHRLCCDTTHMRLRTASEHQRISRIYMRLKKLQTA